MTMRLMMLEWVLVTLSAPLNAQQSQPVLGDLARQVEAERASGAKKASKAYTNKDLADAQASNAAAEPPSGYVSASTGKVVSPEELVKRSEDIVKAESGATQPEEHWRQRADYLRAEFGRAQERMDKLKEVPTPASLPAKARLENELTKIRQMVDGLNKQWDRLAESARVAKVPADWIGAKPSFTP
jgi:hypothetical protein